MFFFIFFSYPNIQTKLKTHVKDYCKLQSVKFFFFLFTLLLFIYFEHKFQLGTLFFEYNRFIIGIKGVQSEIVKLVNFQIIEHL